MGSAGKAVSSDNSPLLSFPLPLRAAFTAHFFLYRPVRTDQTTETSPELSRTASKAAGLA